MNFLTLIFSLLLIFSFGTFIALEKQMGDRRLKASYLGHMAASRKLLSKCESRAYKAFPSISTPEEKSKKTQDTKEAKTPKINPECSRLNLFSLIQKGRMAEPFLYDTALQFLDTFYGKTLFENNIQTKVIFLNAFLKKAKEEMEKPFFCLEKLSLNPSLQLHYYKMLKGTKNRSLEEAIGYPSFLDMFKVEESPSKICLHHAHPDQLSALFGKAVGKNLYEKIHKEKNIKITKEFLERICAEKHIIFLNPNLFDLLEMGKPFHKLLKKTTLVTEDETSKISLRKNIYHSRTDHF